MDFMQNSNVPVRNILWCEFHTLAYEIECSERAKDADLDLGKGHSNLPESTFSVLTKFRAKDTNLHKKHYHAATNLGLLQANMTWCYKNRGPEYHWIPDLYSWMGLPILDGIQEMVCLVLSTSYVIFYTCYITTIYEITKIVHVFWLVMLSSQHCSWHLPICGAQQGLNWRVRDWLT